ncbi:MAG: hypothetical protein ACQET8_09800 [Bacillota bacterium]
MIGKHIFVSFIFLLLISILTPNSASATKWVHEFVVWNGYVYTLQDEMIVDVEGKIGEVTAYSDMNQLPGNFSNVFQKGTPYYSIDGIETDEYIAIKVGKGSYQIADREHKYLVKDTEENSATENDFSSLTKHLLAFFDNLLKMLKK